jgi:hypothetical protein
MENIKNTTKYMKALKIVLIAAVFVVISPMVALADDDGSDYTVTVDSGSNYPVTVDSGSNYPVTVDSGSNYPVTISSGSVGSSGGAPYTTYSSYSGGNYYVPSGSYGSAGGAPYFTYTPAVREQVINQGSIGSAGGMPYYGVYGGTYYNTQPTVTYYTQPSTVPNQVLAYTDTNPNVDSVYLSDVPYTGLSDWYPMIGFMSLLILWSAVLAYVFLKRKTESQTAFANISTSEIKTNTTDASVTSDLMSKMASDNADIIKVEEYARMNKVLLSSDASAKLVKLSRLGKIRVSDYIRSIATGEWIAVGDEQIG